LGKRCGGHWDNRSDERCLQSRRKRGECGVRGKGVLRCSNGLTRGGRVTGKEGLPAQQRPTARNDGHGKRMVHEFLLGAVAVFVKTKGGKLEREGKRGGRGKKKKQGSKGCERNYEQAQGGRHRGKVMFSVWQGQKRPKNAKHKARGIRTERGEAKGGDCAVGALVTNDGG